MKSYRVICPACNSEFRSFEKYLDHVFQNHEDRLSLRMKAITIKKEDEID